MKKTYILEDLDCANCAAKIEDGVSKLAGVDKCSVTFMTKKMVVEAEEGAFDGIIKEAKKLIKKLEPDVTVIEK